MKHRLHSTIATLALILTVAAPRIIRAQTPTPQTETQGKDTLLVPTITVKNGQQAIIEIQNLYETDCLGLAKKRCQQMLNAEPDNIAARNIARK